MKVVVDRVLRKIQTKKGKVITRVLSGADVLVIIGDVSEGTVELRPLITKEGEVLYLPDDVE